MASQAARALRVRAFWPKVHFVKMAIFGPFRDRFSAVCSVGVSLNLAARIRLCPHYPLGREVCRFWALVEKTNCSCGMASLAVFRLDVRLEGTLKGSPAKRLGQRPRNSREMGHESVKKPLKKRGQKRGG